MLTVVHKPHFPLLAKRLKRTAALALGAVPTTVVVFDDSDAIHDYCTHFSCGQSEVVRLSLETCLGNNGYRVARSLFATGATAPRPVPQHGCSKRTAGRSYQSLKKIYGALHGPARCSLYWVSDADSLPFRPFNFAELMLHSIDQQSGLPFQVVAGWQAAPNCSGVQYNRWADAECAKVLALGLGLTAYWQGKYNAITHDFNNWWIYHPRAVEAMVTHAENVSNTTFARLWVRLRQADASFHRIGLEGILHGPDTDAAARARSAITLRRLDEAIHSSFPEAHAACCRCSGQALIRRTTDMDRFIHGGSGPCFSLQQLWSPCFSRYATPREVGRFIVESLGMFGIWGNEISAVPAAVLEAEPRLSWIVNNVPASYGESAFSANRSSSAATGNEAHTSDAGAPHVAPAKGRAHGRRNVYQRVHDLSAIPFDSLIGSSTEAQARFTCSFADGQPLDELSARRPVAAPFGPFADGSVAADRHGRRGLIRTDVGIGIMAGHLPLGESPRHNEEMLLDVASRTWMSAPESQGLAVLLLIDCLPVRPGEQERISQTGDTSEVPASRLLSESWLQRQPSTRLAKLHIQCYWRNITADTNAPKLSALVRGLIDQLPTKRWYVKLDPDALLVPINLLRLLSALDALTPNGAPVYIGSDVFSLHRPGTIVQSLQLENNRQFGAACRSNAANASACLFRNDRWLDLEAAQNWSAAEAHLAHSTPRFTFAQGGAEGLSRAALELLVPSPQAGDCLSDVYDVGAHPATSEDAALGLCMHLKQVPLLTCAAFHGDPPCNLPRNGSKCNDGRRNARLARFPVSVHKLKQAPLMWSWWTALMQRDEQHGQELRKWRGATVAEEGRSTSSKP